MQCNARINNNNGGGFLRSRTFTLVVLTSVVVLLYADQNLLAPNLSAIAEEFGFDGAHGALRSSSFLSYSKWCGTTVVAQAGSASIARCPAVCAF